MSDNLEIWEIRTPTDMRPAFADSARIHFMGIPDSLEPDVRSATDEIFEDFALIEPANDPPGLVAAYLEGISEPLARLRGLGMQLVAVKTAGTLQHDGMGVPWLQTEILVAPSPCWFRREEDADALVHLLGTRCRDGHRVFAESGVGVQMWLSRAAVEQAFEQRTPWCAACALADVEGA